jgi:hypothetical protein
MKQKIKEALQQEYKNLGLNDEAFERVAAFGETLGINEETLANFVKGANDTLKKMQSDADKVRNANATTAKQVEELKAKLAEAEAKLQEPKKKEDEMIDYKALIKEAMAEATQSFKKELDDIKATKAAEDAFSLAKQNFFANDYAKKYVTERDDAWERAVEVNNLTGKKMTAEELQTKAMGYFNTLVSRKGVDTTKPFKNEGGESEPNFEGHKTILEKAGLIQEKK